MEFKRKYTAIYLKMPFPAYAGYIEEMPEIDSVCCSLEELKRELESKLDKWHYESGINYQISEVYRNF
jgi:hypothetical protein